MSNQYITLENGDKVTRLLFLVMVLKNGIKMINYIEIIIFQLLFTMMVKLNIG
jgi:hypothetical protein